MFNCALPPRLAASASVAKLEGRIVDREGKVRKSTLGSRKSLDGTGFTLWTGSWELFDLPPGIYTLELAAQDKDGRLYDSRAGLGGYYRYGPRKIADLSASSMTGQTNQRLPKIHESVFARIQVGAHLYAPIGLPDKYAVVRTPDRRLSGR